MGEKAVCFWSSGKDAATALAETRRRDDLEVVALLTTVNEPGGAGRRVAIHRVRDELVERQAAALGLPLVKVALPAPCPNEVYEGALGRAFGDPRLAGVTRAVFGDLFLEDIRAYREALLDRLGLVGVFPLWRRDTAELARRMLAAGLSARLTVVDTEQLDASFAGRRFDEALLADLPAGVDPCGENGEFHTFATFAPGFARPLAVTPGEIEDTGRFVYCDLLPGLIQSSSA